MRPRTLAMLGLLVVVAGVSYYVYVWDQKGIQAVPLIGRFFPDLSMNRIVLYGTVRVHGSAEVLDEEVMGLRDANTVSVEFGGKHYVSLEPRVVAGWVRVLRDLNCGWCAPSAPAPETWEGRVLFGSSSTARSGFVWYGNTLRLTTLGYERGLNAAEKEKLKAQFATQ